MSEFNPRAEAELEAARKELAELTKDEPVVEQEEEVEETEHKEERQYSEVEKEQMALGWDPNKPNGVSAEEYKRVGEIIEAKRRASRDAKKKSEEIEKLQATVKKLVEYNRNIEKSMYEKAARELYELKMQKVEEGDVEAVRAIEQRQAALKEPAAPEDFDIQEPSIDTNEDISGNPDVVAFKERFQKELTGTSVKDKAFQAYLGKRAYELEQEGATDVKKVLSMLEDELKELFPESFSNPKKNKPALTERSTASTSSKSTSSSLAGLSYEHRATFNEIKNADPSFTEKEYLDMLRKQGKLD